MLYLARMDVTFPESMSPETKAEFVAQEKEYSGNLQREGKMVDIASVRAMRDVISRAEQIARRAG